MTMTVTTWHYNIDSVNSKQNTVYCTCKQHHEKKKGEGRRIPGQICPKNLKYVIRSTSKTFYLNAQEQRNRFDLKSNHSPASNKNTNTNTNLSKPLLFRVKTSSMYHHARYIPINIVCIIISPFPSLLCPPDPILYRTCSNVIDHISAPLFDFPSTE